MHERAKIAFVAKRIQEHKDVVVWGVKVDEVEDKTEAMCLLF